MACIKGMLIKIAVTKHSDFRAAELQQKIKVMSGKVLDFIDKQFIVVTGKPGTDIRCNVIAPGWIDSALNDAYIAAQNDVMTFRKELNKLHPIGRTGTTQEVGDVAVFLASEKSTFITGQTFIIDGERTAKLPTP